MMKFICRNLFIIVTILISLRGVYSQGTVPSIGKVNDKFSESDQFVQISYAAKQNPVDKSELEIPSELDLVPNSDKKGHTQEYQNLLGGLQPLHRTKKSGPIPEATMCFELPSQILGEVPMTVCEPINVARGPPHDINSARYTSLPYSSTPLVVLPPRQVAPVSPWAPGHKLQPVEGNILPPSSTNHVPPVQFPNLVPNPSLPPLQTNYAPFPPQMDYAPFPTQMNYAPFPTQMDYAPFPPQMDYAPFPTQMNYAPFPTQTNYALPPSQMNHAFPPLQMNYAPPQIYYAPPPPQIYYALPPPQMYYASPDSFYNYGNVDKPHSPAPAVASHPIPSKTGLTNTIKDQEETHKVPSPLEDAVTSNDELNARAANTYPVAQFVPQEGPPSPFYGSNNQHLPGRYHPSSVSPFTPGQNINQIPEAPAMKKFAPAALTCRIHDFEAKEPSESIALLQLFLKPKPHLHNSYSERESGSAINSAATSDVRESEAKSEMTHHELQQVAPWDWYQGQMSSAKEFSVNGGQRPGLPKELNQDHWWNVDRPQVWGPQQTQWVPTHELLNKQLLTKSNKNGLQAPGPRESLSSVATEQQRRRNETMEKQMRLDVLKAKLLQQYQSEAEGKQQRGKQMTGPTVHATSADNISDSKQENVGDSRPVSDPTNYKPDPTKIPENRPNSSAPSDETHEIGGRSSERTAGTSCEKSSCPEEIVTYMNLQKGSAQERNINRDSTSYPEETITYVVESTTNSDTSVADWRNKIVHEQNVNIESTKEVPNIVENTSEDPSTTYNTASKKGFSQSPLKIDSAEVPRSNVIPKNEFSSTNPSRYNESETAIMSWERSDVTSLDSSDMMTTAYMKFANEAEGNKEVEIATEAGFNTENYSETLDNNTESSPTKTNGTDSGHNEDEVTGASRVTPGDILVTSVEYDVPLDSVSSDARINSDSHKMDHSYEETEHARANKSDKISKNATGNDSFLEISNMNMDFVPIKIKSRGSRVNVRKENKVGRTGAGEMFRSDILVSSAESNTFNETNESNEGVHVNSNEHENTSSERLFTSEPVPAETLTREMTPLSDSLLTSYNLITESAATMLPEDRTSSHVISSKQSWSSNYTKEELLSTSSTSGRETRFNNESKDKNSNDTKKYDSERMGHMNESRTSLESIDASSGSSDFKKSNVFMQNKSTDYTSTVSSVNTKSGTETRPSTDFAKGEASKVSEEISVAATDAGRTKEEKVSNVWSSSSERDKDSGFTATDIFNTTNQIDKKETEVSGMAQSQKTNRQMKSERGFPQADKPLMGYSHRGTLQNSEMARTGMYPQFQPIAPPNAMQFLVYANAQNPHYVSNGRGPGTVYSMLPQSFIYPSPLTHYDYSARYNSNTRSRSKNDGRRKTDEATNTQAEKNVNDHKMEGELPVPVILEHK